MKPTCFHTRKCERTKNELRRLPKVADVGPVSAPAEGLCLGRQRDWLVNIYSSTIEEWTNDVQLPAEATRPVGCWTRLNTERRQVGDPPHSETYEFPLAKQDRR